MRVLSPATSPALPPCLAESRQQAAPGFTELVVLALAGLLAWLSAYYPAQLPVWAPWEFSWTQFLAAALGLSWYVRGILLTAPGERPNVWRQTSFVLGLGLIYTVLLTHFEYMTQHMFFLNRLQHMIMHHLGPFLIGLAWPGDSILRGMPAPLRRAIQSRPVLRVMHVVQQPVLAGLLFVGLIYLWLVPVIHFHAMLDPRLYTFMNWTMVIDGLLFWSLMLDPRPAPPARTSYAVRMVVTVLVMFPQIILGSMLTFSTVSLYPYYDLCGRLFPSIGALVDQHIGGIILWMPSSMMSSVAFLLILNNVRRNEDRLPIEEYTGHGEDIRVLASSWTGR